MLLCEHASNHIPDEYGGLGVALSDLHRHIAWDIGAAALTRTLSKRWDATSFLGTYSRLLIDLNRPLRTPDSIALRSEITDIPGNIGLSADEIDRRENLIFKPYHQRISEHLDVRQGYGLNTNLISIHSFTPVFHGERREWEAGVLFSAAEELGLSLVKSLRDSGLNVGANVPYRTNRLEDYAVPVHGDDRGVPAVMIEVRQDLLADIDKIETMAEKLSVAFHPF